MAQENKPITADAELIGRALAGDSRAFVQLYGEHIGHIYAVCLRMLANAERAKELAQETMVRAWEMLGSFRNESPFGAWIHRIAVNAVLDHIRAERRRFARVEFTGEPEDFERGGQPLIVESSFDVEAAIASLPPQARAILVLHDIEGYQHNEIADMLGIAIGTSKAQLHRARTIVKEKLQS